ncbi:MAG: hypothetical protein FJ108_17950 [Deltaproteobacteria bacterium]|nr:hypothetical protein [Deltaproteobacteria bacterium]
MPRARQYLIALVFSLSVAGAARAGTVEIYVGFGGTQLYVLNSLSIDLGAIDILVSGATGFTPNPANLGISPADTSYVSRPIPGYAWDSLVISNLRNCVSIGSSGFKCVEAVPK